MKNNRRLVPVALTVLLSLSNIVLLSAPVSAATLKNTSLRQLTRMAAGQGTALRLVFQPQTTGATSITINMNGADTTTWGNANVNSTQTVSSAGCAAETGATPVPGTLTAAGATGTITISGTTSMTAGTNYCVDLTSATAVTNAAAGEYHPVITENGDSTTVAIRTVSNDQITVTATVPPTFSFSLGNTVDSFTSNLTSGAVGSTGGVVATVGTNAKNGWIAWVKDLNTGLTSAAATKTIAATTAGSAATLSAGTEGYSLGVGSITSGTGSSATPAAVSAYSGSNGGGIDTTFRQVVTSAGTAGTAGPGTTFTLKEYAAVSSVTPAATDYTDVITVVGAASF